MKTVFVVLLAFVGSSLAASPIWLPCEGVNGSITIDDVVVKGCSAPPCQLKKGTNATVSITYTLSAKNVTVTAVYNQVYGKIAGVLVKFPGFPADQANACSLGMTCPGKSGDKVTETVQLPVSTSDPSIKVIAVWRLTDDADGKDILACFEAQLQIVS